METKTILQKTTEDRTHYYLRAVRNRYVIYRLRANGNFGKNLGSRLAN